MRQVFTGRRADIPHKQHIRVGTINTFLPSHVLPEIWVKWLELQLSLPCWSESRHVEAYRADVLWNTATEGLPAFLLNLFIGILVAIGRNRSQKGWTRLYTRNKWHPTRFHSAFLLLGAHEALALDRTKDSVLRCHIMSQRTELH